MVYDAINQFGFYFCIFHQRSYSPIIWKGLLLNEIYVLGPYNVRSIESD